jgi:type I restriction enzyme S subunit
MTTKLLSELSLNISSGLTPLRGNAEFWENGTISWLKTEQLGEKYIYETNEHISKAALEKTSIKLFPENSLSIAMYGEGKTRGNLSILKKAMATNQACCNVAIDPDKADFEYVYYFLKTQYDELRNLSSGVRKNLNSNDIKNYPIRLPDNLTSQKKIASVLKALDKKIELNSRINNELEAMVKTLYDYWFVQFDFPDDNGRPYKTSGGDMIYSDELKRNVPKGWVVEPISHIMKVKDGTHESPKQKEAGFPLITSKHLLKKGIDFDNAYLISKEDYEAVNKRSKVETNDILFSMIGSIGEVYKVDEKHINFAIKNVALYKSSSNPEIVNFIYMYLKSHDMKRYMANVTKGSIQKFIGLGSLREMPLLISDEIIKIYVSTTKHSFDQMTIVKRENQELVALRDWLLPMLMNGQVTVK